LHLFRNQLIAVAAILSNNMLTGVSAVMLYADYILRNAGISPEISATATVGIFAIQLIAGLLGVSTLVMLYREKSLAEIFIKCILSELIPTNVL